MASLSAGGGVDPDPDWEALKLPWALIEGLTNAERCLTKERLFMACIASFRAVLRAHVGKSGEIWPTGWTGLREDDAPLRTRTIGRLSYGLLRRSPRALTAPARYRRARELLKAWRSEFGRAPKTTMKADLARLQRSFSQKVNDREGTSTVVAAAAEAFLQTFQDPFARLVPDDTDDAALAAAGVPEVGLGLKFLRIARAHIIERLQPRSPAAAAGLRRGEFVVTVDGWPTANMSGPELAAMLTGPPETSVKLGVRRAGGVRMVTLERKSFEVPHVRADVFTTVADERPGAPQVAVGWLAVRSFHSDRVCAEARTALKRLIAANVGAIVVDLRKNRGGVIAQAACLGGLIAPPAVLLAKLTSEQTEPQFHAEYRTAAPAKGTAPYTGPLLIGIDSDTQSAAELLAGGLQRAGRARLLGQTTYGKGTVQAGHRWAEGVAATLFKEAGRYLVGGSADIHLRGVQPDEFVDVSGGRRKMPAVHADLRYLEALQSPPMPGAPSKNSLATPCMPTHGDEQHTRADWRAQTPMGSQSLDPALLRMLSVAGVCSNRGNGTTGP